MVMSNIKTMVYFMNYTHSRRVRGGAGQEPAAATSAPPLLALSPHRRKAGRGPPLRRPRPAPPEETGLGVGQCPRPPTAPAGLSPAPRLPHTDPPRPFRSAAQPPAGAGTAEPLHPPPPALWSCPAPPSPSAAVRSGPARPYIRVGWAAPRCSVDGSGGLGGWCYRRSWGAACLLPGSPPPCSHGLATYGDQPRGARGAAGPRDGNGNGNGGRGMGPGPQSQWCDGGGRWGAVSSRHSPLSPRLVF